MNKFKLEFINPGYGFRNYKIGEITVYTVRLRVNRKFNTSSLLAFRLTLKELIFVEPVNNNWIIKHETLDWNESKKVRDFLWNLLYEYSKQKVENKYQLKLEL